jgi:hypothetical protein
VISSGNGSIRRVATIPMIAPKHAEGAPGPSQSGTGERWTNYPGRTGSNDGSLDQSSKTPHGPGTGKRLDRPAGSCSPLVHLRTQLGRQDKGKLPIPRSVGLPFYPASTHGFRRNRSCRKLSPGSAHWFYAQPPPAGRFCPLPLAPCSLIPVPFAPPPPYPQNAPFLGRTGGRVKD